MIDVLPPSGKYKHDTWRILLVKCYIDNFVRLWSCIRNINRGLDALSISTCLVIDDNQLEFSKGIEY
jgi:hypothetical protein